MIDNRPQTGVRDYNDSNTWKFLLSGSERAIHRELWGPVVTTRGEAVHHAHALVLDQLGAGDRRVLDLGCRVGTAALYLARRRPVEVVGVTISPVQARLADRYAARGGPLVGDVRFVAADFSALPDDLTGFDLVFAIEAFVHADPAAAFWSPRKTSGLQRLGRPRDRVVHALLPLLRRMGGRSMWAQSLVGGDALQHCHRAGLLQYRLLRFERRTA